MTSKSQNEKKENISLKKVAKVEINPYICKNLLEINTY